MTYCLTCGTMTEEWDSGYYARQMLCIPCWDRKQADARKKPCRRCGVGASEESGGSVRGSFYCGGCKREVEREIAVRTCFACKRFVESWAQIHQSPDGKPLCEKCYLARGGAGGAKMCYKCGKMSVRATVIAESRFLCERCYAVEVREGRIRKKSGSRLAAAFAIIFGR